MAMAFKAKIVKIDNVGTVTVKFTDEYKLANPLNFTNCSYINGSVLNLTITPGNDQNPNDLNFTWSCYSWNNYYLKLKL
jgi:hypothetical protein